MSKNNDQLIKEVKELAPWHVNVDIRDGITTEVSKEDGEHEGRFVSFIDSKNRFVDLINNIYGDKGLKGKSFFDHACNCGSYCYWAKELGAKKTYGYDVRDHWINQAELLKKYRDFPNENMTFEVADLYDIPGKKMEPFDFTYFSGILYHLPEPVHALKIAADLTNEIMVVNTGCSNLVSPEPGNGCMIASMEGTEHLMTGVHKLNWYPSGPKVLKHMLGWLGFVDTRVLFWKKNVEKATRTGDLKDTIGRIAVVASKKKGLLDNIIDADPDES